MKRSLFALLLLLAPLPALAGSVEQAEHVRIAEEMKKLAARNAWSAVESRYQELAALESKGEKLNYEDHWLGAQAARDGGNASAWKDRLLKAQSVKSSDEVTASLQEVEASYGTIEVIVDPRYPGDRALTRGAMPFAPDQVANIRFVANTVSSGESYKGLLVAGTYSLDGQEVVVQVGQTTTIKLANVGGPDHLITAGLRVDIAASFTSAMGPASPELSSGTPDNFGGAGGRAGVGVEINVAPSLVVFVEGGYHNLVGAPTIDGEKAAGLGADTAHLAFGQAGIGYRAGKLWLGLGPEVGFLSASAATMVTQKGAYVIDQDGTYGYEETQTATSATMSTLAYGGSLDVGFALFNMGNMQGAVVAGGGVVLGGDRLMPWGQLGLRFAPAFGG